MNQAITGDGGDPRSVPGTAGLGKDFATHRPGRADLRDNTPEPRNPPRT